MEAVLRFFLTWISGILIINPTIIIKFPEFEKMFKQIGVS